ncbi:hypothetical protein M9H77_32142 [Catharanthus roseus]|uniref:Uncharacterized protein n=1 Tax=Catharanthus roseus TaxID=4058 RepID=A0ACC0A216_CATRO|nr:hypothetical protein M9H77_32142 [Catharanthus roseus]
MAVTDTVSRQPTFLKHLTYFHQHCEEAKNCVHPFPTRIFDKFLRIEMKSREHKVTTYNPREGIYMVKSPIRISGTGNNCVEKMGQEQILMCRRIFATNVQKNLPSEFSSGLE